MAVMLPNLRPLLFDPVVKVRIAMAELLERVGTLNTLQWWTIVPAEELMGVLATDKSAVAPYVQSLLFSQLIKPEPALDLEVLPRPSFGCGAFQGCCVTWALVLHGEAVSDARQLFVCVAVERYISGARRALQFALQMKTLRLNRLGASYKACHNQDLTSEELPCVQACAGMLQLMRENAASGATFCQQLVTQLDAGNGMLSGESLTELSNVLITYLLDCKLVHKPKKRGKGKADDGMCPLVLFACLSVSPL